MNNYTLNLFGDDPVLPESSNFSVGYTYVESSEDFFAFFDSSLGKELLKAKVIGIDTETTGFCPHKDQVRLVQIGFESLSGYHALITDVPKMSGNGWVKYLSNLFSDKKKVFQNAPFDLKFLWSLGVEIDIPIFDTMFASLLLSVGHKHKADLKTIAKRYCDIVLPKDEQKAFSISAKLKRSQLDYAARDACVLLPLRMELIFRLKENQLLKAAHLEFNATLPFAEMEYNGISFDWVKLDSLIEFTKENRVKKEAEFASSLPENELDFFGTPKVKMRSSTQVLDLLCRLTGLALSSVDKDELKLNLDKDTGGYISNYLLLKNAITTEQDAKKLMQHRNEITNRIHPTYKQMGADTGRVSCTKPNLQNIPRGKEYRSLFIPSPGYKIIVADYSQIELRIAASIAQDDVMRQAFIDKVDIHYLTASMLNSVPINEVTELMRQSAKAVNFGLLYGMGAQSLQSYALLQYGVTLSLEEAIGHRESYLESYPGIARWHKSISPPYGFDGDTSSWMYTRTLSGRRRWLDPKQRILTALSNTPVQGTGADILKIALYDVRSALKPIGGKIILNVHDEIVVEVPEDKADLGLYLLTDKMVKAGESLIKDVPIEVKAHIGNNWAEAK